MSRRSRRKIWAAAVAIVIIVAAVAIIEAELPPARTPSPSATTSAAAVAWQGHLYYTTPSTFMSGGNFSFTYPSGYILKEDTLSAKRHEVIIASRDGSQTIEINVNACTEYKACKMVSGVPIGTNASGSAAQKLFDTVTGSFVMKSAQ